MKWEEQCDRYIENCGVYGYPVLDWPHEELAESVDYPYMNFDREEEE